MQQRWFVLLVMVSIMSTADTGAAESVSDSPGSQSTVLITGSNRGIGFEFARQYAELGWHVIATARHPDDADKLQALAADYPGVQIERLDVTDLAGIDELAAKYADQPIDVVLNNAAISGSPSPKQLFGKVDYEYFDAFMRTNVRGPLKVAEAFLPNLKAGRMKQIVAVSSIGGSFANAGRASSGTMLYRTSKAGLNMLMVNIAGSVRKQGITVTMLNPGLVDTQGILARLNEKMHLGLTLVPIADSVSGMINMIAAAKLENTGKFYQWSGEELGF